MYRTGSLIAAALIVLASLSVVRSQQAVLAATPEQGDSKERSGVTLLQDALKAPLLHKKLKTEITSRLAEVKAAPPFLALCELRTTADALALQTFWQSWATKIAAEVTTNEYRLLYTRIAPSPL